MLVFLLWQVDTAVKHDTVYVFVLLGGVWAFGKLNTHPATSTVAKEPWQISPQVCCRSNIATWHTCYSATHRLRPYSQCCPASHEIYTSTGGGLTKGSRSKPTEQGLVYRRPSGNTKCCHTGRERGRKGERKGEGVCCAHLFYIILGSCKTSFKTSPTRFGHASFRQFALLRESSQVTCRDSQKRLPRDAQKMPPNLISSR